MSTSQQFCSWSGLARDLLIFDFLFLHLWEIFVEKLNDSEFDFNQILSPDSIEQVASIRVILSKEGRWSLQIAVIY